jgi:hypothetical protein
MSRAQEGSTGQLLQLCGAYYGFYVITGIANKYFTEAPSKDAKPLMSGMEYLVYSTAGGLLLCLLVVLSLRWLHLQSNQLMRIGGRMLPSELLYIIPSGICTAVVIPTTTLMYTLPISVMVAMVIMRGSVIVISRLIDEIQIRQGILKKKVFWEENVAVLFAIAAVSTNFVNSKPGSFDFIESPAAVIILSSYIVAYFIRIYIMNYFKNTRAPGIKLDNKGFFAFEQLTATITISLVTIVLLMAPGWFGWEVKQLNELQEAIYEPASGWVWAILAGTIFGAVSFFSVFIFMFKGRTATFAGLVNRLTSLIAGTTATLLSALLLGRAWPKVQDWVSFGLILVAVVFLSLAERRRSLSA